MFCHSLLLGQRLQVPGTKPAPLSPLAGSNAVLGVRGTELVPCHRLWSRAMRSGGWPAGLGDGVARLGQGSGLRVRPDSE